MRGFLSGLSTAALLFSSTHALQFTPDSECAALCSVGSNSTSSDSSLSKTNSSDIVCKDDEFSSSGKGILFKNCLNCLQKSDATWEKESDVFWFLYNIRYAFDVCLYSYPDAVASGTINSPCNIDGACAPLEDALETSLLKANKDNQFDYCKAENSIIESASYKDCISCLKSTSSQKYLANFLIALKAGCKQRPDQGDLIGLSGTIFTASTVNITDPNTDESLPGDGGAPVGAMTTGTIVGIAVGCGLALAGFLCIMFIYCRRSRRQAEAIKIETPEPDRQMHDHPGYGIGIQKSSYFVHGHKRQPTGHSHHSHHSFGHGHTNSLGLTNAQYYDSVDQERRGAGANVNYHYAPHSKSNGPNAALPTHPAYIPRVVSRTPDGHLPPPPPRQGAKPNVPDSYALQTYLNAAEDSSVDPKRIAEAAASSLPSSRVGSRNPSPAPLSPDFQPAQPVPAPEAPKSKTFSSLSKLVIPKKNSPPPQVQVVGPTPTSPLEELKRVMRISKPITSLDPRFQDRPLGGGQVLATEPPASFGTEPAQRPGGNLSPLPTSNSHIYG